MVTRFTLNIFMSVVSTMDASTIYSMSSLNTGM